MSRIVKIAVVESSEVINAGITYILNKLGNTELFTINDIKQLKSKLNYQHYDVLIINPFIATSMSLQQMKNETINPNLKIVALKTVLCEDSYFKDFGEIISIYDTAEQIRNKISRVIESPEIEKPNDALSDREKEIVSCVVKGMPNKLIADKLNISVHTVVTHRRNIANKLDIHSTSGLTIYAIVNKLVEIDNLGTT